MPALTDVFTMSNGVTIPKIGFGTWQIPDGEVAYQATADALAAGYRHIDTARAYGNEASVGRAIRDSGLARDEVFVTTKLPAEVKDYDQAVETFATTLDALGDDHVDLYLIHAPWPWDQIGKDCRAGNIAVWKLFEQAYADGRARSIGVSNFSVDDIESLMSESEVLPHANQYRYFIGQTEPELTAYCKRRDILVEGYSPLATGRILDNPDVRTIAEKYGKSVAQLCIQYLLADDILPLPKTVNAGRMAENADVDFVISAEDKAVLDGLTDTTD